MELEGTSKELGESGREFEAVLEEAGSAEDV